MKRGAHIGAWLQTALPLAACAACSVSNGAAGRERALPAGDQVVVIFFAPSSSRASAASPLRQAVVSVHHLLQIEAERQGLALEFVGVAFDWDVNDAIRLLRSYGSFDQVVVGGNWLNLAATEYIWRDQRGSPIVPQIVVVRRHVDQRPTTIDVGADQMLARYVGTEQIIAWAGQQKHL